MFQRKGARICWLYSYQEWLNRFLVPLTISDVLWASFFNFNLLFPAVFPSCNFLKEFLPSYHFCYTIFISSTTCEGESLVKLPTRCDRILLVICLLLRSIHNWYLVWPWSEHAHIITISRMVDFCESYSPFHVCLTIRPFAHLVYATSSLRNKAVVRSPWRVKLYTGV